MKQLVIIGARGFGRECHNFAASGAYIGESLSIKGFLDSKSDALDGFEGYAPILNSVEDYVPDEDDVFICALGASVWRRKYVEIMLAKGGRFVSLISPRAIIHPAAHLGMGVLVSSLCMLSADIRVGDFSLIQPFCNIGHDAVIGDWCTLESYCFMGGGSSLGEGTTLHTRSTILPHVAVGDGATVGAGSVVIRRVKPSTTVCGNPAMRLKW